MVASNVIVLGGCGFIGSHFIDYLLEHTDHQVVNIDSLTYAANQEYALLEHPRYTFVPGSITDRDFLTAVFLSDEPEYIVNFAAESHVTRSIESPDEFIATNILGVYSLLEAFRSYNRGRLHHVSSDEVYGSLLSGEPAFTEESQYRPSTPYAASKAAGDHLVMAWGKTYGLNVTISSSANNYGPRQNPEKLIPHVIQCAISGVPIPVHGSGNQIRDWIHASDHASAIYKILKDGKCCEKYNIGANNEISVIDIVKQIINIVNPIAAIKFVDDRPANDQRYSTNNSKIKELGWNPAIDFSIGLQDTVESYLND